MCAESSPCRGPEFAQVVERLRQARSLLTVCHARPDGDALGSMAALVRAARAADRQASAVAPSEAPDRYAFIFAGDMPAGPERFETLADAAELIVVVDTCAAEQLKPIAQSIIARKDKTVVVDHHRTGDGIGGLRWICPTASATGMLMADLLEELGWPMDAATIQALAAAVLTDTGWLRFPSTDPATFRRMAGWRESGLELDVLYRRLYQNDPPQRLALLARALQSLELHAEGRLALMSLFKADFESTGTVYDDTEDFVNESMRLATVEVAILLSERGGGVRANVRSRSVVDVSAVAQLFGGGGHARAAGCRSDEPLDAFKARLIAACLEALK